MTVRVRFFLGMEHCNPPRRLLLSVRAISCVRSGPWCELQVCTAVLMYMLSELVGALVGDCGGGSGGGAWMGRWLGLLVIGWVVRWV